MPTIHSSHQSLASTSRLDELVAVISARVEAGEPVDLAALTADCPQFRERLEMLLPTLEAVANLERSLAHVGESPQDSHASSATASGATAGLPSSAPSGDSQSAIRNPQSEITAGLLGDFRILREVGRGGMGVVYEAEQISLGRRVALKVLPFAAMLDRQQLARFKNEARAAGTLDHPNIVAIYSVGVERGVHYYAMQLIEGQSLAQVVEQLRRESGRAGEQQSRSGVEQQNSRAVEQQGGSGSTSALPLYRTTALSNEDTQPVARLTTLPNFSSKEYFKTIAQLGIQAAEALDHAHQNGILHRDIKPANLLLECHTPSPLRGGLGRGSDDGSHLKLWITDFGLARMEQDAGMTMTGDILGTLRYMSPEQALAKRIVVDHRSDIYSLGVTLYELLTLEPAYSAIDRQELLHQIAFEEPRPPRQINPRIPADLETIALKATRKEPDHRYSTAHDLAEDLRRFLDDQPIKAKPPTWRERAMKWSRHHPAAIWAAVLFLVATAIISAANAILVTRAYHREATQRHLADVRLRAEAEAVERANSESARAQAVSDYLLQMIFSPSYGWRIRGSQYTVREQLDDYAAGLGNHLADEPEAEALIRHAMGCSYLMLGAPDRAEPYLKRAMDLRRTHGGRRRESLPDSIALYGKSLFLQERYDEAVPPLREALEIYQQRGIRGTMPISVCRDLQLTLASSGRHDEAERAIQQAWVEMQRYDELPPEFAQSPHSDVPATCCSFAYYFTTIGKQQQAAEFLRRATLAQQRLQKPLDSLGALQILALTRLRLGDHAGYREACRVLADPPVRITKNDSYQADEYNLGRIWPCCMGPNAVDDSTALVKQAEEFAANNSLQAPYIELNLSGAAHYRAGHFSKAAQCFEQSIANYPSDPPPSHGTVLWPHLFLAMTKWQQGKHDDARRILHEIQPAIDKSLNTPTHLWQYRQITDVLRREAQTLIKPNEAVKAVENKTISSSDTMNPEP